VGIEPTTFALQVQCSTTKLREQWNKDRFNLLEHTFIPIVLLQLSLSCLWCNLILQQEFRSQCSLISQ